MQPSVCSNSSTMMSSRSIHSLMSTTPGLSLTNASTFSRSYSNSSVVVRLRMYCISAVIGSAIRPVAGNGRTVSGEDARHVDSADLDDDLLDDDSASAVVRVAMDW